MRRRSRLAVPNLPHHVVRRGDNRGPVFLANRDLRASLETLEEFRCVLSIKVHA